MESEQSGSLQVEGLGAGAWLSNVGLVRSRNEDRLLVRMAFGERYLLLLVADGAGGHDSGDRAAEATIASFDRYFGQPAPPDDGDPNYWLLEACLEAHDAVRMLAEGQMRAPASTVVGMLIECESMVSWRFHVGDSRLYVRKKGGMVAQWTRDHNIINGLIDRGMEVAVAHRVPDGGRLTQVLGGGSEPEPEVHGPLDLGAGACVLIVSDGAYGYNEDRPVLLDATNTGKGTVQERIAGLKEAVLVGEAPDNFTAIVWQLPDDAEPEIDRSCVTNSTKSITADDIAAFRLERFAHQLSDDERAEAEARAGLEGQRKAAAAAAAALAFGADEDGDSEVVEAAPSEEELIEASPFEEELIEASPFEEELIEASPFEEELIEASPFEEELIEAPPSVEELMEASPFEEELIEASPSDAEVVEVVSPDAEVAGVQASEPSGHQPPTPPEPASDRMGDEGPGSAVSQWREVSDAEVHGAHWDDLRPKLSGLAALGIGAQRVIAALLFLGLAFVWSPIGPGGKKFYGTPEARPPAASASPGEASASLAPRLLPWPGMPQRRDQARGIVESLDARRWAALPWAERASMLRLISQMLGVRDLQAMKLVWQIGAGGEPVTGSDPHWPAASVSNARRAREAWLAHTMAAAHYPQLLATEGLAELEREIACAQVQVRWPGALGSDPPDAKAFAQWLEACLPSDREGTSVTVRLGSWPSWGVTEDEMEELTPSIPDNLVMPPFQDPGQSLDDLSVRVRDLAVLAATMRRPEMATLVAQLQVLLPRTSGGMSDDLLLEESAYRASVLAQRLSEAAGGSKQVLAEGGIADPPVDVTLPPGAGRRLRRLVAEHSRRVEVQLYRSVQAEPEGPAGER